MTEAIKHSTVMDSDAQQIGSLYAKAILASAGDDTDIVLDELTAVVEECLTAHPGFEQLLASPRFSQAEKERVIDRVFAKRVHPIVLRFLKVLCRRNRIDSLRAIQQSAKRMREQQLGKIRAIVISALPLTDQQRNQIEVAFGESLGDSVILDEIVDPSLLGGIMVRVGDRVYDGSLVGKMNLLRSAVSAGVQSSIRERFSSLLST